MSTNLGRIVVFSGDLSYAARKGIVEIDQTVRGLSWLLVLHSPQRTVPALLRNQWRNFKLNGWRWIPYQSHELLQRTFGSAIPEIGESVPGHRYTLFSLQREKTIEIMRVADLHSDSCLRSVAEFGPDLGLSLAAPILKKPLFSIPRLGTLNLHKGKVPDYRGMPPAFWELWNDEKLVGCTVHQVDEKLDTGAVVAAGVVDREVFSTLRGLQLRLDEVGIEVMRKAVVAIGDGSASPQAQTTGGKTFRKPTLAQASQLDRKLRLPRTNSSLMTRVLKAGVHSTAISLMKIGAMRAMPPRITVLLYHRVSDSIRDNLTVGVAQFDRQMALLRSHCRVLSIEEVIASANIEAASKPLVCVTFDDGYLDNYTNGAMILLRHSVPAAFFVSTGMISSDRPFPHDVRRGNSPIPTMSWDHLREMRKQGFTIGSHTVNHIDCAAEAANVTRQEMQESRERLCSELGIRDVIFAYPYGGRQHMTPERLELVKQSGYVACLSAYGGCNVRSVNRFNVLRRGINWEFSDRSFLYQCLGL